MFKKLVNDFRLDRHAKADWAIAVRFGCKKCCFYHSGTNNCHRFPMPVLQTEDHFCGEFKRKE